MLVNDGAKIEKKRLQVQRGAEIAVFGVKISI
jgi:hypothetical protein